MSCSAGPHEHTGVEGVLQDLAFDHVVVRAIAHRHVVLVHLGDDAMADGGKRVLRCRVAVRIPGVAVHPAGDVVDRHEREAVIRLTRHGREMMQRREQACVIRQ